MYWTCLQVFIARNKAEISLSTLCNGFCCVVSVFEGVLIPHRCPRRWSAVHPAAAVRHRLRLARLPEPCPR